MSTQRPQSLPPGTPLARGKYVVEQVVGQGGFGYVYLAHDAGGRPYAIKQCTDLSSSGLMQFGHEVAVQKLLKHPAFVHLHAQFVEKTLAAGGQTGNQTGESLFTVMDYVPGQSLDDLLADRLAQSLGPFAEADAVAWTVQLLDALGHAHAVGVIHRDIKPGNILIPPGGKQIKIIDFGIAKIGGMGAQTLYGARGVSPPYSPPEQYSQNGQTAAWSDVYAVGATLYHLVTGEAPVDAPVRQSGQTLRNPRQHNGAISRRVEDAILRAMQLNVADRYQTAAAMLADLAGPGAAGRGARHPLGAKAARSAAAANLPAPAFLRAHPLRALASLPDLVRWCDGHWGEAVHLLRSGELPAAISDLCRPAAPSGSRRTPRRSPDLLKVQRAAALADDNVALETVLRALGARPPHLWCNWRAVERALGMGWFPDGRWLWPWWSGPQELALVVQNRGRGYLHGRVDAAASAASWLEIKQPAFGCLAGEEQRIPIRVGGRRLAGLSPEILVLDVY